MIVAALAFATSAATGGNLEPSGAAAPLDGAVARERASSPATSALAPSSAPAPELDDEFLVRNEHPVETPVAEPTRDEPVEPSAEIPHCEINPWVRMPEQVRPQLASIAQEFHERTGGRLRVTSGTRTPEEQAWLMYRKMRSGANIMRIYKATRAAKAIRRAYQKGRSAGLPEEAILEQMTAVIARQVAQGNYISRHLRAGAVDIGARGMSASERATLKQIIRRHRVHVLDETKTRWPHFHLAFR